MDKTGIIKYDQCRFYMIANHPHSRRCGAIFAVFIITFILSVYYGPNVNSQICRDNLDSDYGYTSFEKHLNLNASIPEPDQESKSINRDSLFALAARAMRLKRWTEAAGWLKDILDGGPDDLRAHFGMGICQREIGAHRAMLQRIWAWRRSERHFKTVIARDSTYRDVYYQWALLQRYRRHYDQAIELVHRQLDVKTTLSSRIGIFRLYDAFLFNTSFEEAEARLRLRDSIYAQYALGELYRRYGRLNLADSVFHRVLSDSGTVSRQPILLSLVRLYVQRDEPQTAQDLYRHAVEAISNSVDATLHMEDIVLLVNDDEYEVFKNPVSSTMLHRTLEVFWLRRDPLPAAMVNRRLIEHYRRLIFAEKNYRYDGFRHPMTKSDRLNVFQYPSWYHENYKFEDRGLIYVRFGEPDDKALTVDEDIPMNMSWLYYARQDMDKMIFHFGIPETSAPGYWTLSPGFPQPKINETMLNWDNRFARLAYAANEMEHYALMHEMATDRAKTVDHAFRADRHTWPETTEVLEMNQSVAQFRHSDQEDLVQLAYAIPLSELLNEQKTTDSAIIETGFSVLDTQMVSIRKDVRRFAVRDDSDPHVWNGLFIDEFEIPLALEPHNIAIHARVLDTNKLNGWKFVYRLDDLNRNRLACSSLKLAFDIQPKAETKDRHRRDLKIIPNPTKRFNRTDPVFVYYEIYNLTFTENGLTDYTVHFTLEGKDKEKSVFRRIAGLFGGGQKYQISIQSEQTGTSRDIADYINFDLSRVKTGEYNLKLNLKDNVSGDETTAVAELVLN